MKNQEQMTEKTEAKPDAKPSQNKSELKRDRRRSRRRGPVLRFTPTAWAKLLYFRDRTDNEVGGFAITPADDLLFVTEFVTVKQEVTTVSVKFDDVSENGEFKTADEQETQAA